MTHSRLQGLIAHLPEGVTEIYTHPATSSGFAGAAPGYRYQEELAALTSPDLRRQIAEAGVVFVTSEEAMRDPANVIGPQLTTRPAPALE